METRSMLYHVLAEHPFHHLLCPWLELSFSLRMMSQAIIITCTDEPDTSNSEDVEKIDIDNLCSCILLPMVTWLRCDPLSRFLISRLFNYLRLRSEWDLKPCNVRPPSVGIPTGDSSIGGMRSWPLTRGYGSLVCPPRTNATAQPATIMPKEFAIKAHFFGSP